MYKFNFTFFFITMALLNRVGVSNEKVIVRSTPAGARITVNGNDVERKTPSTISMKDGDLIGYRLPGYKILQVKYDSDKGLSKVELQKSDALKMTIATKTGVHKWAGTDGVILAIYLNGDRNLRAQLDNPGTTDFESGVVDVFEFAFDFPVLELKGLRLIMEQGGDAWLCDSVKVQVETENGAFKSKPIVIPVKVWLSANLKKANRRKHIDLPIKKLKLFDTSVKK